LQQPAFSSLGGGGNHHASTLIPGQLGGGDTRNTDIMMSHRSQSFASKLGGGAGGGIGSLLFP